MTSAPRKAPATASAAASAAAGLRAPVPPCPALGGARLLLAHDWLNQDGGAEVVLDQLMALFPQAPVYTSLWDRQRLGRLAGRDIRPGWMDRLPGIHRHHQRYLPLYPLDWGSRRLPPADLLLSNKSGFCHGARAPGAVHVCYCLTPTRYVWEPEDYLEHEPVGAAARLALTLLLPALRRWDRRAAQGVDHFLAISSLVQERIRRYYGRESRLLYPPTDLSRFAGPPPPLGEHYLVLARLAPYKRIDLAVRAFTQLGRPLLVVGDGRDRARLEGLAGPTVRFTGRLPQDEVDRLLGSCRALIWPGVEDFGLVPVEAMAAGRPVIARRAGGVLDTVVAGETGLFFDEAEPAALAAAVRAADAVDWQPERIRAQAARFGVEPFRRGLLAFLADLPRPSPEEDRRC